MVLAAAVPPRLEAMDAQLLEAVQGGLPICSRPYAAVAQVLGITEEEVIRRIANLQQSGIIKRWGVVVRHHELGFTANAMVVWDIPDTQVQTLGAQMGAFPCVTLCYRRPRRLPEWPYNLFCMIHGKERHHVLQSIATIIATLGLDAVDYKVLFSGRRFKQRGAHYQLTPVAENRAPAATASTPLHAVVTHG
ncbi:MAG: AsnC family transcriptional regulator [Gammaproteobacteria bacterium]|nr:AsnC family transcriptional regulator [Gammaproteobacteria bacterium]